MNWSDALSTIYTYLQDEGGFYGGVIAGVFTLGGGILAYRAVKAQMGQEVALLKEREQRAENDALSVIADTQDELDRIAADHLDQRRSGREIWLDLSKLTVNRRLLDRFLDSPLVSIPTHVKLGTLLQINWAIRDGLMGRLEQDGKPVPDERVASSRDTLATARDRITASRTPSAGTPSD